VTSYELEVRASTPEAREEVTVVDLGGELDLTNAGEIERRLGEIAHGREGLILDLNRVAFVDSAALHMLFRIARRFGTDQRFGIVLDPSALVFTTLAIVGLDEVAAVRPTLDELVAEPQP
jgi:anti-anti-sigma factor